MIPLWLVIRSCADAKKVEAMSDTPRFTIIDGQEYPDPDGQWVFINDAVAAVAAARAEGFETAHNEWAKALPNHLAIARAQGQRDALAGAVATVEALPCINGVHVRLSSALAAIKAVGE